jgi:hypothetical protein
VDAEIHTFMNLAAAADEWSALHPGGFIPEKEEWYLLNREEGWDRQPVSTTWSSENSCHYRVSYSDL